MSFLRGKVKENNKGFSLTEVLTTVAILAILFGLLGVNVVRYAKTTKQTRLDKMAETIYLTAQNNLTKLNTAGRIDEVKKGVSGVNELSEIPGDYDGDYTKRKFEYISSLAFPDLLERLVPRDSIDKGYEFYVEYDAESADVYAVFVYEDTSIYDFYPSNADTLRTSRQARIDNGNNVGYYKGDVRTIVTKQSDKITCDTVIVNKEILKDIIYVNMPEGHNTDKVELTITIKGKTSNAVKTIVYDESSPSTIPGFTSAEGNLDASVREYTLILDKLKEASDVTDLSFKGQYGSTFYPGEDIVISVVAKDVSDNTIAATKPISDTTNSLFANVVNDDASINYIRHLENLSDYDNLHLNNIDVIQKRDLDFNNNREEEYYNVYGNKAHRPISNVDIDGYNGGGFYISNLKSSVTGDAGLFGEFNGKTLSNIILVNANVTGTGNVGSLAGTINNSTGGYINIANCYSYLTNPGSSRHITNNTISNPYIKGNVAGGLVGDINTNSDIIITDSFASTTIVGNSYIGGLIGQANKNISVTKSYSDSYMSGNTVGGLAGSCGNASTFASCYASGFVIGPTTTVGGFVPNRISSVSYSYCNLSTSGANGYSIAAAGSGSNTYYISSGNLTNSITGVSSTSIANLKNGSGLGLGNNFKYSNNSAYPYKLSDKTSQLSSTYPFPAIIMNITSPHASEIKNHYGDWLEEVIKYTIKFDLNYYGAPRRDSIIVAIDETFTVTKPTRSYYNFVGWTITGMDGVKHYIDGKETDPFTSITVLATSFSNLRETTGEVTFTANWVSTARARITFHSGPLDDPYNSTFLESGEYTVGYDAANNSNIYDFSNLLKNTKIKGYIIDGWNYVEGGDIENVIYAINVKSNTGNVRTDWEIVGLKNSNLVGRTGKITGLGSNKYADFYPIYHPISYTIKYDANGGIGAPDTVHIKVYDNFNDPAVIISDTIPTKEGREFLGWSVDKKVPILQPGETLMQDLSYTDGEIVVLYAVWSNNITFSTKATDITVSGGPIAARYGQVIDITGVSATTSEGLTLAGWFDNDGSLVFDSYGGANVENNKYFNNEGKWIYGEDLTVYAKTYTLTLHSSVSTDMIFDAPSLNGKLTLSNEKTVSGNVYVSPSKDESETIFDGWYYVSGGNHIKVIDADGHINDDEELYSKVPFIKKVILDEDENYENRFNFVSDIRLVAGWISNKFVIANNLEDGARFIITTEYPSNGGSTYALGVKDGVISSIPVTVVDNRNGDYIIADENSEQYLWDVTKFEFWAFEFARLKNNNKYLVTDGNSLKLDNYAANQLTFRYGNLVVDHYEWIIAYVPITTHGLASSWSFDYAIRFNSNKDVNMFVYDDATSGYSATINLFKANSTKSYDD